MRVFYNFYLIAMTSSDQLELELSSDTPAASPALSPFPQYAITPSSTPGGIVRWWEKLTCLYVDNTEAAESRAKVLEAEMAALRGDRSGEARRRVRALRAQCDEIRSAACAYEHEAAATFEAALSEFSPALIAMLQAAGLPLADDDEMTVARFWDCLQRPAIEHVADDALFDIAVAFARFCLKEALEDNDTA